MDVEEQLAWRRMTRTVVTVLVFWAACGACAVALVDAFGRQF